MSRRYRLSRSSKSLGMPWTRAEDEKLREMVALGVVSDAWAKALPYRSFGEICERRLDLGLKPRELL